MYEPSVYDDFYNIDIDAAVKQKCLTVKRTYHLNTALTTHVKTTPDCTSVPGFKPLADSYGDRCM